MNYLAHFHIAAQLLTPALPLPEYVLGTALPDLLSQAEHRVRVRQERLWASTETEAALSAGVLVHLATDAAFHKTVAFAEASAAVSQLLAGAGFTGMRVRRFFVAHVLTEIALDAVLLRADMSLPDRFYGAFNAADFGGVRHWAETVTGRPLPGLTWMLTWFGESQYLREYRSDAGVATGLSNVCRRAGQDTFEGENFERLVEVAGQVAGLLPTFIPAIFAETLAGISDGSGEHGLHLSDAADEEIT